MKARIAFVAPSAYAALASDDRIRQIGGAEVQQVLLARELAVRGHRVSFVVFDHGQPDGEDLGGIQAFRSFSPAAGLPGLRFFHPRITGLFAALDRADAEVYYVRGAGQDVGLLAAWCRLRRRPFVFALAHDTDADSRLPLLAGPVERVLYRAGLQRAAAIISQTETQRAALLAAYGRPSTLVRSACPAPAEPLSDIPGQGVVWVGRLAREKRPERLLDLARALPEVAFSVVGHANRDSAYARSLVAELSALPNVHLRGFVPHGQMTAFYRGAGVLLCTSEAEGFPNVFLEAWSHGLPVVSTVDPDGLIEREGLGRVGQTTGELAAALGHFLGDPEAAREAGRRGRDRVTRAHAPAACVDALEQVIASVLSARTPPAVPAAARPS